MDIVKNEAFKLPLKFENNSQPGDGGLELKISLEWDVRNWPALFLLMSHLTLRCVIHGSVVILTECCKHYS